MNRLLPILFSMLLLAVIALAQDPGVTVDNTDPRPRQIGATAPLTEATAKRLAYGAANGANGWVQATASGTASSFSRPTRRIITYTNTSATETVYAGFTPGVTGPSNGAPTGTTGNPIPPGQSYVQRSVVPMYFFSADGAAWIAWTEAYD